MRPKPTLNEQEIVAFANSVLIACGVPGWTVQVVADSTEGYCWFSLKRIDIGLNAENPRQLILHEIAHIGTCGYKNKHCPGWLDRFEDLCNQYGEDPEEDSAFAFYSCKEGQSEWQFDPGR